MGAQGIRYQEGNPAPPIVARRGAPSPLDKHLAAFVARQRAIRASWAAIARMIERSEHDTRLAFDPDYEPDPMWLRPSARKASPAGRPEPVASAGGQRKPVVVQPGTMEARLLLSLTGRAATLAGLRGLLGWTALQARNIATSLKRKGFAYPEGALWRLTDVGEAEAVRLEAGE